jgi:hypothetical protein
MLAVVADAHPGPERLHGAALYLEFRPTHEQADGHDAPSSQGFQDAELLFNAKATKDILTFFFPAQQAAVDSAAISNPIRNFAQGLLVAAVDASYAMSWVELTFDWVVNPGSGVKNALRKLGLKAVRPGSTARKTGICARRRSTKR